LRGRRISWLAGGTLVLALVVVGWIDLVRTNDEVPPFAPGVDTLARYHRIQELDAAFDRRVWIYAVVAAAAMVLACAGADSRAVFRRPASRESCSASLGSVCWRSARAAPSIRR
jgi:hypothetical protein